MEDLKKVMLVEDDALLSMIAEKLINSLGYEVVGKATSGEETINKIDEYNPDILVMDIQLAGSLNGIQTLEKLRSNHNNIPVIFLSGDDKPSIKKKAESLNCVEYLLKPIDASMLIQPLTAAENKAEAQTSHAA